MFVDVNKYITVLTEMKISANQFLLCYLLYTDQKIDDKYLKKGKAMANLYKYSSAGIPWTKEEVRDLVDKGFLIDPNYNGDKTHPDYLEVTQEFVNKIFIQPSAFKELWESFPTTVENFKNPNGPKIKLKVCDIDKLKEVYNKKVKSKAKHKRILNLLEWAKKNNEINFNFENFIRGEMWNTLREIREDHKNKSDNMTTV